jgi:hypothetical protein
MCFVQVDSKAVQDFDSHTVLVLGFVDRPTEALILAPAMAWGSDCTRERSLKLGDSYHCGSNL